MRIAFYPVGCPIQRRLPRLISKTVYYNEKIQQNIFLPDGSRPIVVVIDSYEEATKDMLIKNLQSDLIRFYYGSDLIGNQVGAALKNVIGLAAGILDRKSVV